MKRLGRILIIVLVLVCAALAGLHFYAQSVARKQVEFFFATMPGIYKHSYGKVRYSILTSTVVIPDVGLTVNAQDEATVTVRKIVLKSPAGFGLDELLGGGVTPDENGLIRLCKSVELSDIVLESGKDNGTVERLYIESPRMGEILIPTASSWEDIIAGPYLETAFNKLSIAELELEGVAYQGGEVSLDMATFQARDLDRGILGHHNVEQYRFTTADSTFSAKSVSIDNFHLLNYIRSQAMGGPATLQDLFVDNGAASAQGLVVHTPDLGEVVLDEFSLNEVKLVGAIPTSLVLNWDGLEFTPEATRMESVLAFCRKYGFETVRMGFGVRYSLDILGQRVSLDDIRFDVRDMGGFKGAVAVRGMDYSQFLMGGVTPEMLGQLPLEYLRLEYKDASFANRLLALAAEVRGREPEEFRKYLVEQVSNSTQGFQASEAGKAMVEGVQAFMASPDSFSLDIHPESPLPLKAIFDAVYMAPETIPAMLGLTLSVNKEPVVDGTK